VAANHAHGTPINTYVRGPSVDNQSIVNANVLEHVDSIDSAVLDRDDTDTREARETGSQAAEDQQLLQREVAPPQRLLPLSVNPQAASKQRRFAQQLIVLMVWAGAIALFFNRWGKIRMLLPYQPDYKHEQLKVPGTGVCSASGCNGQHSHQVCISHNNVGPGWGWTWRIATGWVYLCGIGLSGEGEF